MPNPWKLFRYRKLDQWFWPELTQCELYHSAPEDFNDPFDCRLDLRLALDRALKSDILDERRAKLKSIQDSAAAEPSHLEAGVCSFSVNAENPLMWAHYADGHRGVCLRYEFPADYFMERHKPGTDEPFFVGAERVYYGDNVFTEWLCAGDLSRPIAGFAFENAIVRSHVSKAKCWDHEEEFRTVVSRPRWRMVCEASHLKAVYFGLKTPHEQMENVKAVAQERNPSVEFARAITNKSTDFGIEIVPLC